MLVFCLLVFGIADSAGDHFAEEDQKSFANNLESGGNMLGGGKMMFGGNVFEGGWGGGAEGGLDDIGREGGPMVGAVIDPEVLFTAVEGFFEDGDGPATVEDFFRILLRLGGEELFFMSESRFFQFEVIAPDGLPSVVVDDKSFDGGEEEGAEAAAFGMGILEQVAMEDDFDKKGLSDFGGVFRVATKATEGGVHRRPIGFDQIAEGLLMVGMLGVVEGIDERPTGGAKPGMRLLKRLSHKYLIRKGG